MQAGQSYKSYKVFKSQAAFGMYKVKHFTDFIKKKSVQSKNAGQTLKTKLHPIKL